MVPTTCQSGPPWRHGILLRAGLAVAALMPIVSTVRPATVLAAGVGYCVTCTGPSATYICEIERAAGDGGEGMRDQLLCIQRIAHDRGHQSCAVDRKPATSCQGPLQVVTRQEAAPSGSTVEPPHRVAPTPPRDAVPVQSSAAPSGRREKTGMASAPSAANTAPGAIEEPVEKSMLQKAGDSLGEASRRTWSCLSSLFKDC